MRFLAILLILLANAPPLAAREWARGDALPPGTQVRRDLAYGAAPAQVLDVYSMPGSARARPVIVMVHGGAWAFGDKRHKGLLEGKLAHWLPRGVLFVSINYRMLPGQDVAGQAQDVARALAYVQRNAPAWGGDPARVTLMGHSAGAHLAALLSADPALARRAGARRWSATVALDSGALDVAQIMDRPHLPLYDRAFGDDPANWHRLSPTRQLGRQAVPVLLVCSTQRRDRPCDQARAYTARARSLGIAGAVLPQDLDHAGVNRELGAKENYTAAVDRFLVAQGAL